MSSDALSSLFIRDLLEQITADAITNGFATLVGALVGAMLAYVLQRKMQKAQEHKAEITCAHRLMFSLLQQIHTIVWIQKDYVYAELQNTDRIVVIPELPELDLSKNVLDLPEINFMLLDEQSRQLLYDFYLAQESYLEALNQWNRRSLFHAHQLQPALAAASIKQGDEVSTEQLRAALGDPMYFRAVSATEHCVRTLQNAFAKLVPAKEAIRNYLQQRFKHEKFIDFNFAETWGLGPSTSTDEPAKRN